VAPQPVRLAASARTAPTAAAPERAAASPEAQACAEAFARHRWNTVVSSCATAYEQHPDAEIALWLAQAHHRQARVATAGVWAERSIALDDQRPEAFILLARAALLAGQSEEAARAYRAYLALAPRGWHAREARAAAGWRPLP
jgi:Flp pilus assembly protein TadD